ncbi:sulfite exporter TauE/SafE family protein [Celerinatantimonas sp. YJH-8]|uniref:sulfite exporter TauE/SafE family protein n=1 Tax=Celerinatantimonas sp. YJH-8 TaxID=3228714 RepID=UPI0038C39B66
MPDLSLIFLACAIVALGAIVQSLIGFGLAVVAAPLLYFIDPTFVPVPLLLQGLMISIFNWYSNRHNTDIASMFYALIARVPGALLGLWLILHFNAKGLQIMIAIAVLSGVISTLTSYAVRFNRKNLVIAGFISGIFATVAAIGGPPMALIMRHQETAKIRGNLSAFFTLSSTISFFVLLAGGRVQLHHLSLGLLLLPAVILGFFLAKLVIDKVERQHIKWITQIVCSISAFMLLYQAIFN